MPAPNRNEKVKCEKFGDEYRRSDAARHRKKCEKQAEHKCSNCHFYAKRSWVIMLRRIMLNQVRSSRKYPSCDQEFPSHYSLQQHRRKEHGAKRRKPSDTVANLNKIVEEEGEDGEKLKDELSACQHFLVDTEMENGRHKIMRALNRNEQVKCEKFGDEYSRSDAARHRKRCEKQAEHKCPNCHFYTKSKEEMGYHVAKKYSQPIPKQSSLSFLRTRSPSYYSLQQHRRKEHGAKLRKPSDTVADMNKIVEEEGEDGENLKEELRACQHFLVDTEMENGRHQCVHQEESENVLII
ncbi:transcriptional repressor CTCF-like [Symsagittifera roscoffensis]|uniref:transcriptional repressor CTCF-like n=1 Tax=Symsagittifera roscoffensis TaxID=84072 RepID=UPI00307B29BF